MTKETDIHNINNIFREIGIISNGSSKLWIKESNEVIDIYEEALREQEKKIIKIISDGGYMNAYSFEFFIKKLKG